MSATERVLTSPGPARVAGSQKTDFRAPRARRGPLAWGLLLSLVGLLGWVGFSHLTYPSDTTPEGAYLRVMIAVNRGDPQRAFPYIETQAQHACYTIFDYRKKAHQRVLAAYPEPERTRLAESHGPFAAAKDGAGAFAIYSERLGFLNRLRRDVSGVDKIEIQGDRATVQTARGTRYPFRRRENGIWGLTLFTATLVSEAEKAARDYALIDRAAADYERARAAERR